MFHRAFEIVIGHEGGFVDHPSDPGGATKYGISQRAYPHEDIPDLTLERARQIYERDYWKPVRGNDLPPQLALLVFDAAVNNGVNRASKWLQECVGVTVDGVIGPRTLAAARAWDVRKLCAEYLSRRLLFISSLDTWSTFGRGWARRLCSLPYAQI